jgi:imidazoleglycerol phosphate synthase glutamine amidotransferase subunit HisH
MNVAIIKYNAGNAQSVQYALQRLGVHSEISADADFISNADKVIFPGVGHAASAMQYLRTNKTAGTGYLSWNAAHVPAFGRRRYVLPGHF